MAKTTKTENESKAFKELQKLTQDDTIDDVSNPLEEDTEDELDTELDEDEEDTEDGTEEAPKHKGRRTKEELLAERSRLWSLQYYCPTEALQALIDEADHYVYIYHDRDKTTHGNLKRPHYHLLLAYTNARNGRSLINKVDVSKQGEDTTVNLQPLTAPHAMALYLLHDTKKAILDGKALYTIDEVTADDIPYWYEEQYRDKHEPSEFIDDLLTGRLNAVQMAYKYGRDYVRNYRAYNEFYERVNEERLRKEKEEAQARLTAELLALASDPNVANVTDMSYEAGHVFLTQILPELLCNLAHQRAVDMDVDLNAYTPASYDVLRTMIDELKGSTYRLGKERGLW